MGRFAVLTRMVREVNHKINTSVLIRKDSVFKSSASYFRVAKLHTCTSIKDSFDLQRNWFLCPNRSYGSDVVGKDVSLSYQNGLPVINVPLPSRKEVCSFTLRPVTSTVGDFLANLKQEDKGIDRAHIYSADGCRVAASTHIEHLLRDSFVLSINNESYDINPPELEKVSTEHSATLDEVKILISNLYNQLHIDQHQLSRERDLIARLENLKTEVEPLRKVKHNLAGAASKRTHRLMWAGLAVMGTQFGILARLTWWEYSWDIMEPVTYFITYGTAILMYGYFLLTQQEYIYPDARDRQYLTYFHRAANKLDFDIEKYNRLCDEISQAEQDLKRLRDPLQLHLPTEPIRIQEVKDVKEGFDQA